ncbi:hypothetical protein NHX12_028122 [Muraenolepis orangiensis]|uniref:Uncharacterized protein n=1 Tax=Muraenolepis orangiensis TaxID=630683 RepID=A0A9Q0EEY1_9TELE|nr:hypothetical protein NHX12_028122 [Muraenolepis orangiensis]
MGEPQPCVVQPPSPEAKPINDTPEGPWVAVGHQVSESAPFHFSPWSVDQNLAEPTPRHPGPPRAGPRVRGSRLPQPP